jgi:TRAP-type uncharacterized transport system fused permease subunit
LAPYYATAALLVINQLIPKHRMNGPQFFELLYSVARLLIELVVVLAGVGLIVGALSVTGLSGTLVNDLLSIAGDDLGLLLLMGAVTSFVLGIGMTVTAAYIFLAVVLAPALVGQNLLPLSAHLFILYWAMLSYITPPVALGAYAAASIAEANPLRTGLAAMRLGSVIYLVPFIFVLDTTYLLQGETLNIVRAIAEAVVGIWLLVGGIQGYLTGLGRIDLVVARVGLIVAGLLVASPKLDLIWTEAPAEIYLSMAGVGMFVLAFGLTLLTRDRVAAS